MNYEIKTLTITSKLITFEFYDNAPTIQIPANSEVREACIELSEKIINSVLGWNDDELKK